MFDEYKQLFIILPLKMYVQQNVERDLNCFQKTNIQI